VDQNWQHREAELSGGYVTNAEMTIGACIMKFQAVRASHVRQLDKHRGGFKAGAQGFRTTGREAMAHVVVMYKTPKDTAAFDKYYFETHVPIAKKIPGLRKYEVSKGPVATPAGPSGFHLIATLHFDNMAAVQAGFGSPEGKAAGADVPKFATGGADMLLFDNREV
jgi:uncharacterized protein (TIGR02118 family)